MCEYSKFFSTIQVELGNLLETIFQPIKSRFIATSEYRDILNYYQIKQQTFYDLCAMANRIVKVNYDKINIIDLLYFVAIDAKSNFVNASINQEVSRQNKARNFLKGNKFGN